MITVINNEIYKQFVERVLVVHGKYVWSHTEAGQRIRQQMTLHKLGMQSGNSTLALPYMWAAHCDMAT